jgi:signal transduction histidine kinase
VKVEDILDRKGRQVHEVSPDWPVSKAVEMLAAWNVGTTIVTDFDGALVGIISERDIVCALNEFGGSVLLIRVRDLMTRSVIGCALETTVSEALSLMAVHRIRHLPVMRDTEILGLISIRDVLEFRLEGLEEHFTALVRAEQESSRARDEAELASRAKTEFLANMSHELRTPLNAVIGFSEMIAGDLLGPDAAETYRQYAGDINTSGRHLLGLVNQVLDLSNIVSGRFELEEATVDLGELLRECDDLMAPRLAKKRLTLRTALPASLPSVTADAARLKQALLNLLCNAIKFSREGDTVELRVKTTGDGDLAVTVRDRGIGMPSEHIPIALEPFRQIDSDPTHAHNGTGIGLPLAKMLVEKHGGALTLTSAPGERTTVNITIPGWRVNRASASNLLEAV